ncbi:MAG: type II secretion system minor pseudopilin GspI [Magnetococcales bacterium]|nr:type II secretion system minor pseudopilin GspI [Magnetococcales bacterium]
MTGRAAGFSLVEVLVALTVVAVALGALVTGAGQRAGIAVAVRDRTLAHWVADNQVAQLRMIGAWPEVGESQGSEDLAGQEWFWRQTVNSTGVPTIRKVTVAVSRGQSEVTLSTLEAYLGIPPDVKQK